MNDLTIEVLPKIGRDSQNQDENIWRSRLLEMLSKVYKLDVKSLSDAPQQPNANSPILDVFIKRFLDEVDALLKRGLVKCYHKEEGNRKALRGKLLLGEQLRRNFIHKERFYLQYNTYDYEHVMNCLLRQALEVAASVTQNIYLRGRATSTLFNFPELKEIVVTPELFDSLVFDRKTDDYQMAIKLARLLLLHSVPNRVGKGDKILALMFDMNKLWEEYVYIMLRNQLWEQYDVREQESKEFWKQESKGFRKQDGLSRHIIPDIVIRKQNASNVIAILDTKWKRPDQTPSVGDLHQMFAYAKMFKTEKVALIYPSEKDWEVRKGCFLDADTITTSCDMMFLSLKDKGIIKEEVKQRIEEWLILSPQASINK